MPSIPTHDEIAQCAYFRWLDRGCPMDSPEVDWAAAEEELRARETPEGVGLSAPPADLSARPGTGSAKVRR